MVAEPNPAFREFLSWYWNSARLVDDRKACLKHDFGKSCGLDEIFEILK